MNEVDSKNLQKPSKTGLTRRRFFDLMAAASAVVACPNIISPSRADTRFVIRDPGGVHSAAFSEAFYKPFGKEMGLEVVAVSSAAEPTGQIKAIIEAKNYIWDVVGGLTASSAALLAGEGDYLEKLNLNDDKNVAELDPRYRSDYMIGSDVYSTVMGYSVEKYKDNPPKSWADFWDVKKFPGQRAFRRTPYDCLEIALVADGVPLDKIYPINFERAFKKLDEIKPFITWYPSPAASTQMLVVGEVDMIASGGSRIRAAIEQGAKYDICWNGALWTYEGWAILRGSPKADMARKFIAYASDAKRQAAYTKTLVNGPTNPKAFQFVDPQRAKIIATYPKNLEHSFRQDYEFWAKNKDEAVERFGKWILA